MHLVEASQSVTPSLEKGLMKLPSLIILCADLVDVLDNQIDHQLVLSSQLNLTYGSYIIYWVINEWASIIQKMIDLARSNSIFISLRTNVNIMIETTQSSILWTYGFTRDWSVLQFYNFDWFCVQAVCIVACRFVGLPMRNYYYGGFGWASGLFRTSWKPGQVKGPKYTIWEFANWMRTRFSFNNWHDCMVFWPVFPHKLGQFVLYL